MPLLRVVLTVHAGCDEFGVVNDAIVVRVNYLHGLLNVSYGKVDLGHALDTLEQLLVTELAVTVLIDLGEGSAEVRDLRLGYARSDVCQSRLSQPRVVHVRLDVADHLRVQLDEIILLISLELDPGVVESFLSRQSNVGRSIQQLGNQIFGVVADRLPHLGLHAVLAVQHIVDDIFVLLATKWRLAAQHNEHDDAHGPDVALRRITALEHLGRNIVRSTVGLVHDLVRNDALGEAEIDELNVRFVALLVQQEVLGLDITVANAILVQVAERVECLFHDGRRLLLGEMLGLDDVVEELAALAQFGD